MNGRFVLNRQSSKVMGVASGLADWTGVDVLIIRLSMIAATLLVGNSLDRTSEHRRWFGKGTCQHRQRLIAGWQRSQHINVRGRVHLAANGNDLRL